MWGSNLRKLLLPGNACTVEGQKRFASPIHWALLVHGVMDSVARGWPWELSRGSGLGQNTQSVLIRQVVDGEGGSDGVK